MISLCIYSAVKTNKIEYTCTKKCKEEQLQYNNTISMLQILL